MNNNARIGTDETDVPGPQSGSAQFEQSPEPTLLWRTESGACYTQDSTGRIYRNGELEAIGPLLAFVVRRSPDRTVALDCRVFLVLDNGLRQNWRLTTRVTELYAQPTVPQLPEGWGVELDVLREFLEQVR
jgi:hypothetical protein